MSHFEKVFPIDVEKARSLLQSRGLSESEISRFLKSVRVTEKKRKFTNWANFRKEIAKALLSEGTISRKDIMDLKHAPPPQTKNIRKIITRQMTQISLSENIKIIQSPCNEMWSIESLIEKLQKQTYEHLLSLPQGHIFKLRRYMITKGIVDKFEKDIWNYLMENKQSDYTDKNNPAKTLTRL